MWDDDDTHMARLVFFRWLPFPLPSVVAGVLLGVTFGSLALYARKVANIYPGAVELPLLSVLLIA